jgi:hypothetical protein
MTPRCIITGCQLTAPGFTQHGDLWELGEVFIFNACGEPDYGGGTTSDKVLEVHDSNHDNYFERHNVYVVSKLDATLNGVAQAYIARGAR